MTRAIMAIQLTSLYSQALIEWNGTDPATRTWDALKVHFTMAYIVREQSGTGSTEANGYHTAANSIAHDDAINNMESTLAQELTSMQTANNANHQSALAMIAALQQQLALLTVTPRATATPTVPLAPMYAPAYSNHQRYNGQENGGRFTQGSRGGYRGNRGGAGRNNYAPTPLATATPTGGIPPTPSAL